MYSLGKRLEKLDHLERMISGISISFNVAISSCLQFIYFLRHLISIKLLTNQVSSYYYQLQLLFPIFKHLFLYYFIFVVDPFIYITLFGLLLVSNHFSHCKLLIIIIFTNSSQIILLTTFLLLSKCCFLPNYLYNNFFYLFAALILITELRLL